MSDFEIKPVKGYNAFAKIFSKGKRFRAGSLIAVAVFGNSNFKAKKTDSDSFFYFGVGSSKKVNRKAVCRNRIKRLLRICVKECINEIYIRDGIVPLKYGLFIYNGKIEKPGMINLNVIKPLVKSVINDMINKTVKK